MRPRLLSESPGLLELAWPPLPEAELQTHIAAYLAASGRRCWAAPEIRSEAGHARVKLRVYPQVRLASLRLQLEVAPLQPVDEAQRQAALRQWQESLTPRQPVTREARAGDWVTLDWYALEQGIPVPGLLGVGISGRLRPELLPHGLWRHVAGLQVDQRRWVDVAETERGFQLHLRALEAGEPPPLDERFPALCRQPDWPTLLQNLNQRLEEFQRLQWRERVRERLIETLTAQAEIPLPEDLLAAEQLSAWQSGEDAQLEALGLSTLQRAAAWERWRLTPAGDREIAARLRSSLALRQVVTEEGLSVSAAELQALLRSFSPDAADLQRLQAALEASGRLQTLIELLLVEKVADLLWQRATLTFGGKILSQPES